MTRRKAHDVEIWKSLLTALYLELLGGGVYAFGKKSYQHHSFPDAKDPSLRINLFSCCVLSVS